MTPAAVIAHYRRAAAEGKLLVQQCRGCQAYVHYPRVICPHCRGLDLEWRDACGRGTVYSFSVVHQPPSARWKDRVPYILAVVDLEEGPRMMSNIVDCEIERVRCGMSVTVTFEERDDRVLAQFRPAGDANSGGRVS
jgi:hypothetical protein